MLMCAKSVHKDTYLKITVYLNVHKDMFNLLGALYNVLFANIHAKHVRKLLIIVQVAVQVFSTIPNASKIVLKDTYRFIQECNVADAYILVKRVPKPNLFAFLVS